MTRRPQLDPATDDALAGEVVGRAILVAMGVSLVLDRRECRHV